MDAPHPLPPAPTAAVRPDGSPLFGAYRGTIEDTDLDHLAGVPRWRRLTGQKRWIYIGVFHPQYIAGAAVVDATYVVAGFAFAFHRESRRLWDHHGVAPRLRQAVPDTPVRGTCRFGMPGSGVTIQSDALRGERNLRATFGRRGEGLRLDVTVQDHARLCTPLSVVSPLGGGLVSTTRKVAGAPASGALTAGRRLVPLEGALAVVDYSHCLPHRRTRWLWAAGAGHTADGRTLGLNLVGGWSNEQHGENAAWLDGQLMPLGRATFLRERSFWRIECDRASLRFFPEGQRRQDLDFKLVVSRYVQPMGRYTGTLRTPDGEVALGEVAGVTEDHEATW